MATIAITAVKISTAYLLPEDFFLLAFVIGVLLSKPVGAFYRTPRANAPHQDAYISAWWKYLHVPKAPALCAGRCRYLKDASQRNDAAYAV